MRFIDLFKKVDSSQRPRIEYIGFELRLFASVVDTILSIIILMPFFNMLFSPDSFVEDLYNKVQVNQINNQEFLDLYVHYMLELGGLGKMIANTLWQWIIAGIVIISFWFLKGATPGKMLLGIKIVDEKTLSDPKFWQWILRYIGYLILFPGFLWIPFDRRKQGWHDKLARTVVISVRHLNPKG